MKKLILAASIFALAVSAQAATLKESFTASNGVIFNLHDVRQIESLGTTIKVSYRDGDTGYFQDAGGTVFSKILASEGFPNRFVKLSGVNKYIDVQATKSIVCNPVTGMMTIGWFSGGAPDVSDSGCVVRNQISASGN